MSLLIKNATLVSGKRADVLVEGNLISKVAPSIPVSCEKVDASGKLLIPGFVNTHTHSGMSLLREVGEGKELDGWLSDVRDVECKLTPASIKAGSLLSCAEMIHGGITTFSDMYFHMDEVAQSAGQSGMRAVLGYGLVDGGSKKGALGSADEGKMESELSIGERFVKDWHGKEGGRIMCSIAPHSIYLCSGELLKRADGLSKKHGIPLHIHLSETRGEVFDCLSATGKRPANYLDSLGILSSRTVAAHCAWLSKEEARLLAKKKVSASLNPVSNMYLAGGGSPPLPEMREFGMNISLGTDGQASSGSLSMFEAMKTCGLLVKNSRWGASSVHAGEIFSYATLGGARALGINAGEVKQGMLADLILVDKKAANLAPLNGAVSSIVFSAHPGNVTDVLIDGKVVMEDGKILTFNEGKAVEEAGREADSLLEN